MSCALSSDEGPLIFFFRCRRLQIGVVGGNGAGKSTLLKIMAGVDPDFDGIAVPQTGARIGYLAQEPVLAGETVDDVINEAVQETKDLLDRYNELSGLIGDESLGEDEREKVSNEWARLQDAIEAKDGWELERNVERALDALRCAPGDAKHAVLSGGERRRVALCGLLLRRPDLLILDEVRQMFPSLPFLPAHTLCPRLWGCVYAVC